MAGLGELNFVEAEKMAFDFTEAQPAGWTEQRVGLIFACAARGAALGDGVADREYGERHVGKSGGSRKMAATTWSQRLLSVLLGAVKLAQRQAIAGEIRIGMRAARTSLAMTARRNQCAENNKVNRTGAEVLRVSVGEVLRRFVVAPRKHLLGRWNWKSAVMSSGFRAAIFFFVNLTAGRAAAVAAMSTELVCRGITSGFYGAISEGFAAAEPPWAAALWAVVAVPVVNHALEFGVHRLRGTQKLLPSIAASVVFTVLSTLFNLYAMRRGALIVGTGRGSLREDLRRSPALLWEFLLCAPRWLLAETAKRAVKVSENT